MKNIILPILFILTCQFVSAQKAITGTIKDEQGNSLPGVNVFLKNTMDGGSTDNTGSFSFKTNEIIQDTLVIRLIGYESIEQKINLQNNETLGFELKEEINELNSVVITAGSFEASDEKKMTILKPIDIVRTAGSNGDLFGALQTLPGAQRVGETEGLFVRGGAATESKTMIDGMVVQNPFFSSLPDVRTRGRFSPFLFKGTAFSTGGYSAQYGQALSSVLNLESEDLAAESNVNIFLSPITGGVTGTKRWDKTSVALSGNYTNTAIGNWSVPQNVNWIRPYTGCGGSAILRHQFGKHDMLKSFSNYGKSSVAMYFLDFDNNPNSFIIDNQNYYENLSYKFSSKKWTFKGGLSYSYNEDKIKLNNDLVKRLDDRFQTRLTAQRDIFKNSSLLFGAEVHQYAFESGFNNFSSRFQETYSAVFVEAEVYLSRKIAGRIGVRAENSSYLSKTNLAPRVSLAYKTGEYSQLSFAFGEFYQNPDNKYLFATNRLDFEKAFHYILNYQWMKEGYTFRVEAFYKDYQNLVRELDSVAFNPDPNRLVSANLNNSGYGYAGGVDFFWRDNGKTFKNIDYWISYSYIDTERFYQNFTSSATPVFASRHNLSFVYKQFIQKLNLDINFTYSYASGRTYYNPNGADFLKELTPDYHNVNLGLNYITKIWGAQSVLIFSVNNVLNTKQVFGYRYSPDRSNRVEVNPSTYISFFLGLSMTFK